MKLCDRAHAGIGLGLGLLLLVLPGAAPASPAYVVRLAVSSGEKQVRIAGKSLAVYDEDVRDLLLKAKGTLRIRSARGGLIVDGTKNRPRSVLLTAEGGIAVGDQRLIGEVEIIQTDKGLLIINRLSLGRYLEGLLGAEMSPNWPLAALQAQAVAARTFFLHRRLSREDRLYDLSATTLDQVYRGIERESKRTRQAVRSTRGEVLTRGQLPAETLFHACCGGRTRSAASVFGATVPYLIPIDDPDCSKCPKHRWTVSIDLDGEGRKLGQGIEKVQLEGDQVVFRTRKGRRSLNRRQVRKRLGAIRIPSAWFTLEQRGRKLILRGKGSGHGVGLCQWGAHGMAEKGKSYEAILKRYYPDTRLRKLY
jgi:stage II sporulation protein D